MITTLKINKTESGWPSSYTPSLAEIKAYFLGWRMCNSDGTAPYVSGDKYWHKWVDMSGLTDVCPTESYVGSERHLTIIASDTAESVEVDIDADLTLFSGDNYIGADVPAEIDLSWTEINESIEDRLLANHKYLVYLESKANDTGVLDAVLAVTNGVTTVSADPWTESDTDFTRRFLTFTPETTADWQLKVVADYEASTPFDYTFRNLTIVDLTNMGELNAPMQEVFGETNWYDLTDEQLEAYFDEVGHIDVLKAVGYSWDEGSGAFTINNYGETLDSTPLSTVKIHAELHGWHGVYDEYCNYLKTTNIKRTELQDATIDSISKSSDKTYVSIEVDEIGANHAFIINNEGQIIATTNFTSEASVEWDSSNESPTLTRI